MKIFYKTSELQSHIAQLRQEGKSIGFVPTMGALHEGHFSLIRRANNENDITVCSIFVNPTQFNEKTDLDKYPRTLEADSAGLSSNDCDILFAPTPAEIYPDGSDYAVEVDLLGLDQVMEGAHRPGHFAGVVQVVKRLLDIVTPHRLYMGQKDFQQFTIIRQMIKDLQMPVELVVCAIGRDDDGLARSSRNVRLTSYHRKYANCIHNVLLQSKEWMERGLSADYVQSKAMYLLDEPGFRPEYFDIIDGYTLLPIGDIADHELVAACTAVWAGDVRLIDNMIIKGTL